MQANSVDWRDQGPPTPDTHRLPGGHARLAVCAPESRSLFSSNRRDGRTETMAAQRIGPRETRSQGDW